jgi:phosphopantothenoylcysteine decarboxylase/phosphopantothenate--cysteine ligase
MRRVVLCVTGGVAAYKAAYLARRLIERGTEVRVVMTSAATEFIGAQTFASITGFHTVVSLFDSELASPHTELAAWADAVVVAPCTTNTISRLANGVGGDAVSTLVLASTNPLFIAPAMHTEMWEQPSTRKNVSTLKANGAHIVGPVEGSLAGGDIGLGRMADPDEIVAAMVDRLSPMADLHVVVSAGGTREAIDPVRYIGNRSSGKMGYAVAEAAARRGANVTLVSSASLETPVGVAVVAVESADEMAEAVWSASKGADVVVMAAAVADYKPSTTATDKLRRKAGPPEITLSPTPDILSGVVAQNSGAFVVGFAAEVGSLDHAVDKAKDKGVDLLVGNDVAKAGSGFGSDTNEVVFISKDGTAEALPLMAKSAVADRLMDRIMSGLDSPHG